MKLLFLHDGHYATQPLIGCKAEMLGEGIVIDDQLINNEESLQRAVHQDCDVILALQTIISDAVMDPGKPVIIFERLDGSQMGGARRWLPRVNGVIKSYALQPPELHNKYDGRVHAHFMREAGYAATDDKTRAPLGQPLPQLSTAELRNIRLGYGFGAYPKVTNLFRQYIDWSSKREYAVHFAGHMQYDESEVEIHRRFAYKATNEWCLAHPKQGIAVAGRSLSVSDYYRTMFLSRAVVSPWGWGESAHRDYEAIMLGAVIIKPPMSHVNCWPQIYIPGQTCVECRPDFADVGDIIDQITKDWKLWTTRRQNARKLVEDAAHPVRIARMMAHSIRSLL